MALSLYAVTCGVRLTPDGRASVLDVIPAIKGCSSSNASLLYTTLVNKARAPEFEMFTCKRNTKFKYGGNNRPTPVADARGITKFIWALPGKHNFRKECAVLYTRYIGTLDHWQCTKTSPMIVSTSLET